MTTLLLLAFNLGLFVFFSSMTMVFNETIYTHMFNIKNISDKAALSKISNFLWFLIRIVLTGIAVWQFWLFYPDQSYGISD